MPMPMPMMTIPVTIPILPRYPQYVLLRTPLPLYYFSTTTHPPASSPAASPAPSPAPSPPPLRHLDHQVRPTASVPSPDALDEGRAVVREPPHNAAPLHLEARRADGPGHETVRRRRRLLAALEEERQCGRVTVSVATF